MDMCYDGALVMPNNCALMDQDEMTYVNGGGTLKLTIKSDSVVIGLLSAVGGTLTRTAAIAALTAAGLSIAGAIELGTAGAGTLAAGAFLLAWEAIIPTVAAFAVTYGINALKGHTFEYTNKYVPSFSFSI